MTRSSDRAGIETRVLKGPALAHRYYDDPSLRSFGDGDMLVRGADIDATVEILQREGLQRRFGAPRSSFDRRFVKAIALVADDGLELDLHRALTPGPFGVLFDVEEIFDAAPDHIDLGGHRMSCLAPELAFAHACAHAVLGDDVPRLVAVRDVAQLLAAGLDVPATIALVRSLPRRRRRATRGWPRRDGPRVGAGGSARGVGASRRTFALRSLAHAFVRGRREPLPDASRRDLLGAAPGPRSPRVRVGARVPRPQVPPGAGHLVPAPPDAEHVVGRAGEAAVSRFRPRWLDDEDRPEPPAVPESKFRFAPQPESSRRIPLGEPFRARAAVAG